MVVLQGVLKLILPLMMQDLMSISVMSALDADVIKTYVELGMGVGIVNDVAYDTERDHRLKQIDTDLFGLNTTWIAVRKGHLLRGYGYELEPTAPLMLMLRH